MNELICPSCGASNPADAIFCQACFRSLVKPEKAAPEKTNEWLDDLRNLDESAPPKSDSKSDEPESLPENEEDIPDWLARIRQRNREENPPVDPQEGFPESNPHGENLPDWFTEIQPSDAEQVGNETAGLPDWLNSIDNELEAGKESPSSENKDWLERLPFESELSQTDPAEEDWLSQFRDKASSASQSVHENSAEETAPSEFEPGGLLDPTEQGQGSGIATPFEFESSTQPEPPGRKGYSGLVKSPLKKILVLPCPQSRLLVWRTPTRNGLKTPPRPLKKGIFPLPPTSCQFLVG